MVQPVVCPDLFSFVRNEAAAIQCPFCAQLGSESTKLVHLELAEQITMGHDGRPEAHLHFMCERDHRFVVAIENHKGATIINVYRRPGIRR